MGETTSALGASRFALDASCGVAALGVTAAGLGHAADFWLTASVAKAILFALVIASGFFVAAGVLRLATWALTHDAYSALAGAALLVMGGCAYPWAGSRGCSRRSRDRWSDLPSVAWPPSPPSRSSSGR